MPYLPATPGKVESEPRNRLGGVETDSDYPAEASGTFGLGARYSSSSFGRFLSPDWSARVEPVPYAKLDNPQTLNLYLYADDNPESVFDPDGHDGEKAAGYQMVMTVRNAVGVSGSTRLSTLSAAQRGRLEHAIAQHEGFYRQGTTMTITIHIASPF